jgi:branched-chain amino acid transport system ATP-binding protein
MFEFNNVSARYGTLKAVKDISIKFADGEIAAILGHNGAGKTTLLKCAVGEHTQVSGTVHFNNELIVPGEVHRNVRMGIGFVPQENNVFGDLMVDQNLRIAGMRFGVSYLKTVYELFPRLEERKNQLARSLSGGERQMLAVGMALMTRPKVMFLDEPTTGLAPLLVQNVLRTLKQINETMSVSTIIVEQNVQAVLKVVKRVVVLKMGRIAFDGPTEEILSKENLWALF